MPTDASALTVRDEIALTPEERTALGNPSPLDNFAHYAKHATARTQLFFAKVYQGDRLAGLAPITKLVKHRSTELLRPEARWWMQPLFGLLARKTTYMIDPAFLAFEYVAPFFCPDPQDETVVRAAVSDHLQKKPDVDTVWLAEPRGDTAWAQGQGYDCFAILPMVHVELSGHRTIESYCAALGKKRRKNWRADRQLLDAHGGAVEYHDRPIPPAILEAMHACLLQSAARSSLRVPFEDVLNSKAAFLAQDQQALVARVGGRIAGFFSFFVNGETMQQCHGGFDYDLAHSVKAYANLIQAAIEHALTHGYQRLTLGPLNNETKRRAGSHLMPMMASMWCRDAISRFFVRKLFLKNLQVYRGDVNAEEPQDGQD
jgi:hypothetical protein